MMMIEHSIDLFSGGSHKHKQDTITRRIRVLILAVGRRNSACCFSVLFILFCFTCLTFGAQAFVLVPAPVHRQVHLRSIHMASTPPSSLPPPRDGIDFVSLPWNLNLPNEHSYIHLTTTGPTWEDDDHLPNLASSLKSYQNDKLPLTPATTSLNYGTTIWEGLKTYRISDSHAVVFRMDQNYHRMKQGAQEMGLPMPSPRLFYRAIQTVIQDNAGLIPPPGDGMKLYVRPMLLGSGQQLGLYPSPQFSFLVYVSPTGNYFKSATTGLNLHLETKRSRASRGGVGSVKCAGNYALALKPLLNCKQHGFMDNVFLELDTYEKGKLDDAVIQEMSAANVFCVLKNGEIVTPSLDRGTILPGVTRNSVLQLVEAYADELKDAMKESTGQTTVKASSRDLTVKELRDATEAFCTGTAAELVPIMRIATSPDEDPFEMKFEYGSSLPGGPVTTALLKMLREAMTGKREYANSQGWLRDPFASADEFCKH